MVEEKRTNVALQSTAGHFVEKSNVVMLDKEKELFMTEGASELVTQNHTTIKTTGRTFIVPQQVVDPVEKIRVRSKD